MNLTLDRTRKSCYNTPCSCGLSSSGRAPPCQGGGSEFEPRSPLQTETGHPIWMPCFFVRRKELTASIRARCTHQIRGEAGLLRRPHKLHILRHCLKGSALLIPLLVLSPPKTLCWFSAGNPVEKAIRGMPGSEFEPRSPLRVGASFVSPAPTFYKSQSALTPLLLLSESQSLRWVAI